MLVSTCPGSLVKSLSSEIVALVRSWRALSPSMLTSESCARAVAVESGRMKRRAWLRLGAPLYAYAALRCPSSAVASPCPREAGNMAS
jgi:hypothetical protein